MKKDKDINVILDIRKCKDGELSVAVFLNGCAVISTAYPNVDFNSARIETYWEPKE